MTTFEEMLKEFADYRPTRMDRMKRIPYRVKNRYHIMVGGVRHAIARVRYGWSPQDVWGWDTWHARIVAESLEHYAEVCHGWPGDEWGTFEEYKEMIEEIAGAYRAYYEFPDPVRDENGEYDFVSHHVFYGRMMERLERANKLMIENYQSIWD